jgi:hypothetical protein
MKPAHPNAVALQFKISQIKKEHGTWSTLWHKFKDWTNNLKKKRSYQILQDGVVYLHYICLWCILNDLW